MEAVWNIKHNKDCETALWPKKCFIKRKALLQKKFHIEKLPAFSALSA